MKKFLFILLALLTQSPIAQAADAGNLRGKRLNELHMVEMHNPSLYHVPGQEHPNPTGNQNLTITQALELAREKRATLSMKIPAHWSKELGQRKGEGPIMASHGMYRGTFYGKYYDNVAALTQDAMGDIQEEFDRLNAIPGVAEAIAPIERRYELWQQIVFGYLSCGQQIAQMEKTARETTYGTDTRAAIVPFTPCVVDPSSRPLAEVLAEIKTFLDANKREVVVLKVENVTDDSRNILDELITASLGDYAYQQNPKTLWPTVEELVENNKRLVPFITTHVPEGMPLLNGESAFIWSANWDYQTKAALLADHHVPTDNTNYQRWESGEPIANAMCRVPCHLTQGFGGRPDLAQEVNTRDVIEERVRNITGDRKPTFLPLDFIDIGDGFDVVAEWNEG